jgi:hypothetical protein
VISIREALAHRFLRPGGCNFGARYTRSRGWLDALVYGDGKSATPRLSGSGGAPESGDPPWRVCGAVRATFREDDLSGLVPSSLDRSALGLYCPLHLR